MPDKLDKITRLTQSLSLPEKGLIKLKNLTNVDDYDVLVQNKKENKTYKVDSSLFRSSSQGTVLFPNGFEDVTESRDFQHSDVGKALRLANDDVFLTMPEGQFWTEEEKGQIIVVIADAQNVGYDKTFELPVLMQSRDEANSLVGEYALLVTGETGGQSNVATISSAVLKDGDDWKTAIRYLKDRSGIFPNGGKIIDTDYTLQAEDAGCVLILDTDVQLTIPNINPIPPNMFFGITAQSSTASFIQEGAAPEFATFLSYGGQAGVVSSDEVVIYESISVGGSSVLVLINTQLVNDNSVFKTKGRYYFDNLPQEGSIIELGVITFEDVNTSPSDATITIPLVGEIPADYYLQTIFSDTTQIFDASIVSADVSLVGGDIGTGVDLTSVSRVVSGLSGIMTNALGVINDGVLNIVFTGVNPQNLTTGSVTIKALIKKFPE